MEIRKGTAWELDELAALYNAVCGALEAGINYPGWRRDIYPTRQDAERGVAAGELYVAVEQGAIAGTMILRQGQEPGYRTARWGRELTDSEVLTVYTFAVHPGHAGKGVGAAMLAFAEGWLPRRAKRRCGWMFTRKTRRPCGCMKNAGSGILPPWTWDIPTTG